jgi:hypothetical protein
LRILHSPSWSLQHIFHKESPCPNSLAPLIPISYLHRKWPQPQHKKN